MNIPIVRLEVQGIKHTMQIALAEYIVNMDADIQHAIEQACTAENIVKIIEKTAREAIDQSIKDEVSRFFRYGEGRAAIKEAVHTQLSKRTSYDD